MRPDAIAGMATKLISIRSNLMVCFRNYSWVARSSVRASLWAHASYLLDASGKSMLYSCIINNGAERIDDGLQTFFWLGGGKDFTLPACRKDGADMQAIRRALINSVEKRRLALKMSGYLYFNRLHLHSDYDVPIGKRRDLYPKRFGSTLINGGWQNNTERFALATRRSPSISRSG